MNWHKGKYRAQKIFTSKNRGPGPTAPESSPDIYMYKTYYVNQLLLNLYSSTLFLHTTTHGKTKLLDKIDLWVTRDICIGEKACMDTY